MSLKYILLTIFAIITLSTSVIFVEKYKDQQFQKTEVGRGKYEIMAYFCMKDKSLKPVFHEYYKDNIISNEEFRLLGTKFYQVNKISKKELIDFIKTL